MSGTKDANELSIKTNSFEHVNIGVWHTGFQRIIMKSNF
jgi:hypothetical protein